MAISAGGLMAASAVGALVSGASQFGSSYFNSARTYKQNAALMGLQYLYQRQLNKHAYQDTTYSMRQAGINPMLAINNGASSGSVGLNSTANPSNSSVDMDLLGAISTAKQLKNDTQRVDNETSMNKQNIAKSKDEQALINEQKQSTILQNEYQATQNKYADAIGQQNLVNSVKQGQLLDAQAADYGNQILNRNASTAAQIANLSSDTANKKQMLNGSLAADAARAQWIKEHPHLFGIGQTLQNLAPGLIGTGAAVGAGAGIYSAKTQHEIAKKPVTKTWRPFKR